MLDIDKECNWEDVFNSNLKKDKWRNKWGQGGSHLKAVSV